MEPEIWIKHYSCKHKILLVGEGDFSFAACLAQAFGHAPNLVATSLDSKSILKGNYPTVEANLTVLENRGSTILHGVSVRTMADHSILRDMLFDRIVFNFPHAGFGLPEHWEAQIRRHQKLVRRFLNSAQQMLRKGGQVHVTHKTSHPFDLWEIGQLGAEAGLRLRKEAPFYLWDYPGYTNKRGSGKHCNASFPVGECSTFKFVKYNYIQ